MTGKHASKNKSLGKLLRWFTFWGWKQEKKDSFLQSINSKFSKEFCKKMFRRFIKKLPSLIFQFLIYLSFTMLFLEAKLVELSQKQQIFSSFIKENNIVLISVGCISIIVLACMTQLILQWKNFIKIFIAFICYLVSSYIIRITMYLNDKSFVWTHLKENSFFQFSGWYLIGVILLMAIILRFILKFPVLKRLDQKLKKLAGKNISNLIVAYFGVNFVFTDSLFSQAFQSEMTVTFLNANLYDVIKQLTLIVAVNTLILVFIFYCSVKGLTNLIKNRVSYHQIILMSAIFALIFNLAFQYGVRLKDSLLDRFIFPGATSFQLISIFLFCVLLYLILNRFVITTGILLILGLVISIANYLKQSMRNEPLLLTDIAWIKEPKLLASFLNPKLLVIGLVILSLVIFIILLLSKFFLKGKIIKSFMSRLVIVTVIFILVSNALSIFKNEKDGKVAPNIPIISTLNNWYDITWFGFSSNASYKSITYVWVKQVAKDIMEKPDGYSKSRIDELVKKYSVEADKINKSRSGELSDQTVVFVLSESFSDPNRITSNTISKNPVPKIEEIKDSTTSGLMKSDGFGGGTANMEFQALTGLAKTNFSANVSVMNVEVVPKLNEIPSISNLFKNREKIVIHGANANNYGRKNFYERLKFNHLIFTSGTSETLTNTKTQGISIGDQSIYKEVLDHIDNKQPQFFSVITMQNHVPWSETIPENITASNPNLDEEQNKSLNSYVKLLYHTDNATKEFLSQLSKLDKKVTVVFYGDHLPGLYSPSVFTSQPDQQYLTDYFIWSNKDNKKLEYSKVNSSDFPALLSEHTNTKVSPYYALLTEKLKQEQNKNSDSNELTQAENDLRLLQYDITLGKNYIGDYKNFFE